MTFKILGSGCRNCMALYDNVKAALAELAMDAKVEKVTDFAEIAGYGVMSMPALVLDEKVVASGKVLKPAEVKAIIENAGERRP